LNRRVEEHEFAVEPRRQDGEEVAEVAGREGRFAGNPPRQQHALHRVQPP